MITQGCARISVSLLDGKVEIEGSEEFVASHLVPLQGVISEIYHSTEKTQANEIDGAAKLTQRDLASLEKFTALYDASEDGKIRLLTDLPGDSIAHKTVSAALLISYANSLLGTERTPLETIRKACKEHACHDTNNFAATIKREKALFVHSGTSYIKLSEAGRKTAQDLVEQLIGRQQATGLARAASH